jgi:RNA-directed DNA polymerase
MERQTQGLPEPNRKWLKAGILEPDNYVIHIVLDKWFEEEIKPRLKGKAIIYRYEDDFVCAFRFKEDVDRFFIVLPRRMGKYGLELESTNTSVIRFSWFHPSRKCKFHFLGFEFCWFPYRKGFRGFSRGQGGIAANQEMFF